MSQQNPAEKSSLTPAENVAKKEPEHNTALSNGVWDAIKKDYGKPLAWVEGNIAAPMYNEALRPINTVIDKAEKLGAPVSKLHEAAVPDADVHTAAFYTQQVAATGISMGAQLIAGHFVGRAFRSGGEALAREAEAAGRIETAQSIRNFASSRMLHNVAGATAYAAALDPEKGQTRTGNALAAGEGMLLFEGANKLTGSSKFLDIKAMAIRATTGANIGASQQFLSTLVSTGHADFDADHYQKAMASGAFMNVLLPGAMKGVEAVAPKLGLHTYADRFAEQQHENAVARVNAKSPAEPGSWADPKAADLAIAAGRMDITAKARLSTTEETNIDHKKGLITLKDGDSPAQFVEENAHIRIARDPQFEARFTDATKLIGEGKTEEARQEYIQARVAQEVEAHKARYEAIQSTGAKAETTSINPAEIAKEYAGKFALEAQAFISSGGKFRPEMSFSHGGGGADGVHFVQSVGIGPHPGHDGMPHITGDSRTSLDAEQIAAQHFTTNRTKLLDTLPDGAIGTTPKKPGDGWLYTWPEGARVLGHDNVRSLSFQSADLPEYVLKKFDPQTGEISSWVRNYAEPQKYVSPEDRSTRFTFTEWEQDLNTAHSIFQVAKPGTWNLPEKSTFETFPHRKVMEFGGYPLSVRSILRHNDAAGTVDYGLANVPTVITEHAIPQLIGDYEGHENWKPGDHVPLNEDGQPAFYLFQRSQEHTDGSITDFAFDPRKLDPEFPRNRLVPDISIDSFAPNKPLSTTIGDFENIQRMSHEIRYEKEGESKKVYFGGDQLVVVTQRANEAPTRALLDSIKENYPDGRDTIWGTASQLEIKSKSMVVTLTNGGKVEIFNRSAYPDGAPYEKLHADGTVDERFANNRFGNVRRVDTAPPTLDTNGKPIEGAITLTREIQTPEGAKFARVFVPQAPFALDAIPNRTADAYQEFPGPTMARTYYLTDGVGPNGERIPNGTLETKLDNFQTEGWFDKGPYNAVWRYPRGVSYLNNVANGANNWTKSSLIFEDPERQQPAIVVHSNDVLDDINTDIQAGRAHALGPNDVWVEQNGQYYPRPLVAENYPYGQPTQWGTAFRRLTYHNGLSLLGMGDNSSVIVEANGQFVQKLPPGQ